MATRPTGAEDPPRPARRFHAAPRTMPVTLVVQDRHRWLVAPDGQVARVHNARAAGRVHLRRGLVDEDCAVREVDPHEAGPTLTAYLAITGPPRADVHAHEDVSVEEFVAETAAHPVFHVTSLTPPTPRPPQQSASRVADPS